MPEAPRRVRPEELAKAVAKAVDIAKAKHKLAAPLHLHTFEQDFARIPWWIVGRILRERLDLDQAHKVSEAITGAISLKSADVALQPTTIRIGDDILVGFIEKYGGQLEIPQLLQGPGGPSL